MILSMNPRRLDVQKATTVYKGRLFTVEQLSHQVNGLAVVRDVIRHPGAVVIIPVLDDGSVVFIRNYRVAVNRRLLELPAGTREREEEAEATACRELEEETGFSCKVIRKLGSFFTTPGLTDELMHVFLAKSLIKTAQRLEPGEQIDVEIIHYREIPRLIRERDLVDGKSIAALQFLDMDPLRSTTSYE